MDKFDKKNMPKTSHEKAADARLSDHKELYMHAQHNIAEMNGIRAQIKVTVQAIAEMQAKVDRKNLPSAEEGMLRDSINAKKREIEKWEADLKQLGHEQDDINEAVQKNAGVIDEIGKDQRRMMN